MSNPTLNQMYANSAQVVDIQTALVTAEFLIELSKLSRQDYYDSPSEELSSITKLWKLRAYAFLNRACELECVPVHIRLVEFLGGDTAEAWFSYSPVSDFKELLETDHTIFIGYSSRMNELEARMRALS